MSAILVTGGAGYIGSHTTLQLLEAGHDIVVIDNLSNASKESIHRLGRLCSTPFKFFELDILDKKGLEKLFLDYQFSAVMHFAGLKSLEESTRIPFDYYQNNIAGTLNLLDLCSVHGCKQLVFSSSATVYGQQAQFPVKETASVSAINSYGHSKLYIENILADLAKSDPSWRIAVLRYFNPVGAHPSGEIGEEPKVKPDNLIPFINRVAARKIDTLKIFGGDYQTKDGTAVRDYIHVLDLADGHLKALEKIAKEPGLCTYNLGTGQGYSVLEVVNTFQQVNQV